jgi:hypothetical protein
MTAHIDDRPLHPTRSFQGLILTLQESTGRRIISGILS